MRNEDKMKEVEKALEELGVALEDRADRDTTAETDVEIALTDLEHEEEYAWVWGEPSEFLEWDCTHPSAFVDYGDDDEQGECLLCGAMCDWHYNISNDDGYTVKEREPHEWHEPDPPKGIIGQMVKLGDALRSLEEEV